MTRRTFHTAATLLAILALPVATQGCAALVVGYLVGDAIQRNEATKTCRANLAITNQERLAKGLDAYPDQCAR